MFSFTYGCGVTPLRSFFDSKNCFSTCDAVIVHGSRTSLWLCVTCSQSSTSRFFKVKGIMIFTVASSAASSVSRSTSSFRRFDLAAACDVPVSLRSFFFAGPLPPPSLPDGCWGWGWDQLKKKVIGIIII